MAGMDRRAEQLCKLLVVVRHSEAGRRAGRRQPVAGASHHHPLKREGPRATWAAHGSTGACGVGV